MSALSQAQQTVLATLLERSPDPVVNAVAAAVAGMHGARARALEAMLDRVLVDRRLCAAVFGPLTPLFQPRAETLATIAFPPTVLRTLWRWMRPELSSEHVDLDRLDAAARDALIEKARAALADTPDAWPELSADALAQLSAVMTLAPVLRRRMTSLKGWLARPTDTQASDLRLLLSDASALRPDGACVAFEVILANLAEPEAILRVVALACGGSGKHALLQGSELAVFVERVLDAIDARAARVKAFDPTLPPDAATAATVVADVRWIAQALAELDVSIDPPPGSEWSRRAIAVKTLLDQRIGLLLKTARRGLSRLFTHEKVQVTATIRRDAPRLDGPCDGADVEGVLALLRIVAGLRGPAAALGAEADRFALASEMVATLALWADEALREASDDDHAQPPLGRIELCAQALEALDAGDEAHTVRRRVAAVQRREAPMDISSSAA